MFSWAPGWQRYFRFSVPKSALHSQPLYRPWRRCPNSDYPCGEILRLRAANASGQCHWARRPAVSEIGETESFTGGNESSMIATSSVDDSALKARNAPSSEVEW